MESEKAIDRNSAERETDRMADGAGNEERELPGSEARRGNEAPQRKTRSAESEAAAKNQSSVKPEDYAGASESGGGIDTPKR